MIHRPCNPARGIHAASLDRRGACRKAGQGRNRSRGRAGGSRPIARRFGNATPCSSAGGNAPSSNPGAMDCRRVPACIPQSTRPRRWQRVDVRCGERPSVARHAAIAQVVGERDDDVGPVGRLGGTAKPQEQQRSRYQPQCQPSQGGSRHLRGVITGLSCRADSHRQGRQICFPLVRVLHANGPQSAARQPGANGGCGIDLRPTPQAVLFTAIVVSHIGCSQSEGVERVEKSFSDQPIRSCGTVTSGGDGIARFVCF